MDNTSFFLSISFGKFQHDSYASMRGQYGSKIVRAFSGPFIKASSSTINIFWWYKPFIYGGLCPIYFSRELGCGGFVFVL
jgi:hypothetical protein